jgi:eukaryotic-like serine/threonine-protein kinase
MASYIFNQTITISMPLYARNGNLKWLFAGGHDVPFDGRCGDCSSTEEGGWDYWASSPVVVYALNAVSGKLEWKLKTGGRVRSSPAVYENTVYVGGMDGRMYAIDSKSGTLRWTFKTEGNKYYPAGEIQSSPAVESGLVVFGSRDYYLYALEANTGKLAWKTLHEESWILGSPGIANGSVYVGSSDAKFLQKVDLKSGKELWRTKVSSNIFSSPAVAGDYVYAGDVGEK